MPEAASVQRVLHLLTLITKAETVRLQLFESWSKARNSPDFLQRGEELARKDFRHPELKELRTLQAALNGCLGEIEKLGKRYRWSPTVRGSRFLGLGKMFTWSKGDTDRDWENAAVWWLLSNVDSSGFTPSRLLRLRQCRLCSEWFSAITDHQRYCSVACRQKSHSSSSVFKEKRARYMREVYRPGEKEKELNAKRKARRAK